MTKELELVSGNAGAMARPDATPVQLSAPALFAMVERAAKDPSCDVNKAERMMDMALKLMALEAEQKFNAAMASCQSEIPPVLRDAQNPSTNSRYTRLETLHEKVMPIATKHGFSMSFGTADCPVAGNFRVTCVIRHNGGHSTTAQIDLPNDSMGAKGNQNKTLVHGAGSSMSYARRYLTMMIFNVALTNEDDDGNRGQRPKPPGPMRATEKTREWFLGQIADIREEAHAYAIDKGYVMPNAGLDTWDLANVPVTKQDLAEIRKKITGN